MKKLTAWLGVLAVMFLAGEVMAASNLIVRVTPTGTRGLTLSSALLDMGALNLGSTNNLSAAAIVVTSTGSIVQTYAMHLTGTGGTWTAAAAAAADTFNLRAVFNTAAPVAGDFAGVADDLMSAALVPASATAYAVDASAPGVKGFNVAPAAVRNLWFKLDMPTTSTVSTAQDITGEIQAQ